MDVAFSVTRGRLDFARNKDGDFYLDDLAVYAVLATFVAHKTEYAFDGDLGTFRHKITKDGSVTGTRLQGCGDDCLEQCVNDELITSGTCRVDRLRPGALSVTLSWKSPTGKPGKVTL
ncbi:MAG TPA: hypothetical protein PKL17_18975 [Pseudomonadota bacterium]|nr:hypothetical protein [Pseudomonadota bacterium]